MSLKQKVVSTFVSLTLATGALAGSVQTSSAGKLTKAEIAALAGIGGLIVGSIIANPRPAYHGGYRSAWERHLDRCFARYRTYDPASDTYVGYDGDLHRCRL
jgi:hypothetical protein